MNRKMHLTAVILALGVAASVHAPSDIRAQDRPAAEAFAGNWRGKGTIKIKADSPREAIVCRASGNAETGKTSLILKGRCGGGSFTGTFQLNLKAAGTGRYSGTWRSSQEKGEIPVSGRGNGGTYRLKLDRPTKPGEGEPVILVESSSDKRFTITAGAASGEGPGLTVDFQKRTN